ncbi:hypothetical protein N7539_005129 [Penicillium diatomitis]|uniref:Uncharacterized protein n=1 Tax=Penicillium diatomitis TaxID=2819901 RepID=A0A9W9X6R0_9EURO|nr:uncharacterized protein N7539_005129 [Penicillium diatomitis]KAJ5485141.1 hypothetical protein N7539_005129 [Penicillium diatomitis]
MAFKNSFRLRENVHRAKAFLQRPLQKVNRAMSKLRPQSASCSFNYEGYDEHYDLSQPLTAYFRYAPVREWLPPLHSRRGMEMTPIINFPYSYEDDLYITLYRDFIHANFVVCTPTMTRATSIGHSDKGTNLLLHRA